MGYEKVYIMLINFTATLRPKLSTVRDTYSKLLSHGLKSPCYQVLEEFYIKFLIISNS